MNASQTRITIIQLPATMTDEQYQRTLERDQPALLGRVEKVDSD